MTTLNLTADAYAALRAIAVGGGDMWTNEPEPDGTYNVTVDDDLAVTLEQLADRQHTTVSAVILSRITIGSN